MGLKQQHLGKDIMDLRDYFEKLVYYYLKRKMILDLTFAVKEGNTNQQYLTAFYSKNMKSNQQKMK